MRRNLNIPFTTRFNSSQRSEEHKPSSNFSNIIAIIALIASFGSIYLQFFYENFDLNVSVIEEHLAHDSLIVDLIYHNKGNQDATILKSEILFKDKEQKIVYASNRKKQSKEGPFIIAPAKQVFESLSNTMDMKKLKYAGNKTQKIDTFIVIIRTVFLNQNSMQADKEHEIGWISYRKNGKVESYTINYQKISLPTDSYYSAGSLTSTIDTNITVETLKRVLDTLQVNSEIKKK